MRAAGAQSQQNQPCFGSSTPQQWFLGQHHAQHVQLEVCGAISSRCLHARLHALGMMLTWATRVLAQVLARAHAAAPDSQNCLHGTHACQRLCCTCVLGSMRRQHGSAAACVPNSVSVTAGHRVPQTKPFLYCGAACGPCGSLQEWGQAQHSSR